MLMFSMYIIVFLTTEAVISFFCLIAGFYSFNIFKNFNPKALNEQRYNLAKQGYLVCTIIAFCLCIKILIFLFFIYSMDSVTSLVPGAMCAVGIVDGSDYGIYMLVLKIVNLFFLAGWLFINHEDGKKKFNELLKLKFGLFLPIVILILAEFILEFLHFYSIKTDVPVQCCSVIFKPNSLEQLSFFHTNFFILSLFYVSFLLTYISAFLEFKTGFGIFGFTFMLSSIYAVIRFFSPYIYELPTHKCPFCMLQSDYNYIGYFIYILIFCIGICSIFAFVSKIINVKFEKIYYKISIISGILLLLLLNFYPISYFLRNGVWL